MANLNIEEIKSKLNVYNAQDGIDDKRQSIHIEITLTDACNMNCRYCFEHSHINKSNLIEEEKQLNLIKELCINFDTIKFKDLQIVFWGGEPMLNMKFMHKIIETTSPYRFVNYFMYSNGTLIEKYNEFVHDKLINSIKDRFRIQISYDGNPINKLERYNDGQTIIDVARMLKDNGFSWSLKATASSKTIKYIPLAWKEYEKLYNEFGNIIQYSLTLDMTSKDLDKHFDEWKCTVIEIMAHEYQFVKQHKHFLMSWLNYKEFNDNKMTCCKDYACHLHTNGNIYICHGCAYVDNHQKFLLGSTKSIDSLTSILKTHNYGTRNNDCFNCGAVFCNMCHVYNVNPNDIFGTWLSSIDKNKTRCMYFKYFGLAKKILDFMLINEHYSTCM